MNNDFGCPICVNVRPTTDAVYVTIKGEETVHALICRFCWSEIARERALVGA